MKTRIYHPVHLAAECKKYFGDDYEMYRSYCKQFRRTISGRPVIVVPISLRKYNDINDHCYV